MSNQRFTLKSLLLPIVIALAVLSGGLLAERYVSERSARHEQAEVYNQLGEIRAGLESTIHQALRQMHGIIAVVSNNPKLTQDEFSHYTNRILGNDTALKNLGVARDLVIELVHPIEGNEEAVGVDYRNLPNQDEAAIQAVESGETVFTGPVRLVQGGTGFIVRMPIFLPSEENPLEMEAHQLLSAVIDINYLYRNSGLEGESQSMELAISKYTNHVSDESVFYGNSAIFKDELTIVLPVGLPNNQWLLAGRPVSGWNGKSNLVGVIRAVSLLFALMLGMLTFTWMRSLEQRNKALIQLKESQLELDAVLNNLPSMMFLKDAASGRYLRVNKVSQTLLGLTNENTAGKTSRDLFPPELSDLCWDTDSVLSGGKKEESVREVSIETLQGQRTYTSLKVLIRDEEDDPKYILGIYNDITDLRRTEIQLRQIVKKLQRSETNYRQLVDSNPLCVHVLDSDFKILSMNQAGLVMMDVASEQELIGKSYSGIAIKEDREELKQVFLQVLQGKSFSKIEYRMHGIHGIQYFSSSIVPLYNGQQQVDRIMGITEEITALKLAEAEQNRVQRELQQAQKMEALGQLTGGIAHDFNNILGIILGYTGLAREASERQGDTNSAGYLNHIEKASIRAKDLVTQMLAFSRNDPGEDKVLKLEPLINDDVSLLRATLPSSVDIKLQFESDVPGVKIDPVRLNQLLMNLSINARDVMEGNGTLSIRLGVINIHEQECSSCHKIINGEWVALTVADNGGGISEKELSRIFEPFYSTKEVGKGTGLGLSVVHGILHGYHGHILVKTRVGQGTEFRLLLPPAEFPDMTKTGLAKISTEVPQGKGRHVLVVDDEPVLLEYICEILELHNYRVTTSESAVKALLVFEKAPDSFDLILTDQTMPGFTGLELVDRIRAIRPDFPVVVCSGFSEALENKDSLQPGVGYLQKPADSDELLKLVGQLIEGTVEIA